MPVKWLLLANGSKALIIDISKRNTKFKDTLVREFIYTPGRLKAKDLNADRPGSYKTPGTQMGAFQPDTEAHDIKLQEFALIIADFLHHAALAKQYQQLLVAAEPHFYGILKRHLTLASQKIMQHYLPKDYLPLPDAKLQKAITGIQHEYF